MYEGRANILDTNFWGKTIPHSLLTSASQVHLWQLPEEAEINVYTAPNQGKPAEILNRRESGLRQYPPGCLEWRTSSPSRRDLE